MSAWGLGRASIAPPRYGDRSVSSSTEAFLGKLIEAIPGDVVGGYLVVAALVPGGQALPNLVVAIAFFLLTPIVVFMGYRRSAEKDAGVPVPVARIAIATVSFALWVFSLPAGPLQEYLKYPDWVRGLALVAGTIILGLLVPQPKEITVSTAAH